MNEEATQPQAPKPNKRDSEYMKMIGSRGGKNSTNRPFKDREKAREAGAAGGRNSKRGKAKKNAE